MSINRVAISGNLTRDSELRATRDGSSVLSFGVAVNDRRRNPQTGEWEDYPNFVDCTVFGNRAESLADILKKGLKVAIEGRLHYRSWQAQDGSRRSALEVRVDEVELMTSRGDRPQARQRQAHYPQQAASPAQVPQPRAPQPRQAAHPAQAAPTAYQPAAGPYPAPQPPSAPSQPYQPQAPLPQAPAMDVYDEDIPF